MPANINSVVLVGNLTRDPELRHTPSGTAVCSLRLAVNSRRKDEERQLDRQAELLRHHRLGPPRRENCAQYLAKGRPVGVQGRLDVARVGRPGRDEAPGGRGRRRQRPVPRQP